MKLVMVVAFVPITLSISSKIETQTICRRNWDFFATNLPHPFAITEINRKSELMNVYHSISQLLLLLYAYLTVTGSANNAVSVCVCVALLSRPRGCLLKNALAAII